MSFVICCWFCTRSTRFVWSIPHEAILFLRDIAGGDKCLSSLLYLSTLDNKSENSKKFYSLLLISYGKQRKSSTAL